MFDGRGILDSIIPFIHEIYQSDEEMTDEQFDELENLFTDSDDEY